MLMPCIDSLKLVSKVVPLTFFVYLFGMNTYERNDQLFTALKKGEFDKVRQQSPNYLQGKRPNHFTKVIAEFVSHFAFINKDVISNVAEC